MARRTQQKSERNAVFITAIIGLSIIGGIIATAWAYVSIQTKEIKPIPNEIFLIGSMIAGIAGYEIFKRHGKNPTDSQST